ncbi:hypothetical protein RyT2_12930 [Pseudolactococcus yaeyamensis]
MNNTYTGQVSLDFTLRNGRTIATRTFHQGVSKILQPQYLTDQLQVTYFLLNLGGGGVAGDTYRQDFKLDKKVQVHLTTQSAMKIFTANGGKPVSQKTKISLADDALLEYINDPVILYEGAKYCQTTVIDLTSRSHLFFVDSLTQGWDELNQGFKYDEIDNSCQIIVDGRLEVLDRLRLRPQNTDLVALGRLEKYTHLASGWVITPSIAPLAFGDVVERLEQKYDVLIGISELSILGFSFRILAQNSQLILQLITELRTIFRKVTDLPVITENRKY